MNPNTNIEGDPQHGCYVTHKPNVSPIGHWQHTKQTKIPRIGQLCYLVVPS